MFICFYCILLDFLMKIITVELKLVLFLGIEQTKNVGNCEKNFTFFESLVNRLFGLSQILPLKITQEIEE